MTDVAMIGIGVDATQVKEAKDHLDRLAHSGRGAETATGAFRMSWMQMLGSIAGGQAIYEAARTAVTMLVDKMKEVTLVAARYETMGVVMEQVGKTAGYSAGQMRGLEEALRKQGISGIEARESLTRLVQANMDLSKASQLARVAQDAAVIANINSSQAFERMVYGIQSGQTEILRTMGINVSFEASYEKMAKAINKTTKELNENDKTQARLNSVLEAGVRIQGIYEEAMGTVGKQLTSLTRFQEEYNIELGKVFQSGFLVFISEYTRHLKLSTEELRNNTTEVEIWGDKLATWAAIAVDTIRWIPHWLTLAAGAMIAFFQAQSGSPDLAWQTLKDMKLLYNEYEKEESALDRLAKLREQQHKKRQEQAKEQAVNDAAWLERVNQIKAAYDKLNLSGEQWQTIMIRLRAAMFPNEQLPPTMLQSGGPDPTYGGGGRARAGQRESEEQRTLASYRERMALLGKETEVQKALYEIEQGRFKAYSAAAKLEIMTRAEIMDWLKKEQKQREETRKQQDEWIKEDLDREIQQGKTYDKALKYYDEQNAKARLMIETLGMTKLQQDKINVARAIQKQLDSDIEDLRRNSVDPAKTEVMIKDLQDMAAAAALVAQRGLEMADAWKKFEDAHTAQVRANQQSMKQLMDQSTQSVRDAETEFKNRADELSRTLTDALMRGFEGGKDAAKNFIDTLKNAFNTMVLKPIIQAIVSPVAGFANSALSGLNPFGSVSAAGGLNYGGSGGDSVLGALSFSNWGTRQVPAGVSWAAPGGVGTTTELTPAGNLAYYGGAAAIGYGIGQQSPSGSGVAGSVAGLGVAVGMAGAGSSLATGVAGSAIGSSLGITAGMVPVIGWIVAAAAILYMMFASSGGGPKTGGSSYTSFTQGGAASYGRAPPGEEAFFTPNQKDSDLRQLTGGLGRSYFAQLRAWGVKAPSGVSFGMGYDTDPEGTAQNRLTTRVTMGGQQVYGFKDLELGRDNQALQDRMNLETKRMLIVAFQNTELPEVLKNAFAKVTAAIATEEEVDNILAFAGAWSKVKLITKEFDKGIADIVGPKLMDKIADALNAAPLPEFDPTQFKTVEEYQTAMLTDHYRTVIGAIDESLVHFIDEFEGTDDELTAFAGGLAQLHMTLKNTRLLVETFGGVITLEDITGMAREGENVVETYARISDVFGATNLVLQALGKTTEEVFGAIGLASYDAREDLAMMAGGIKALSTQVGFYMQNFLTPQQRADAARPYVTNRFADLGITDIEWTPEWFVKQVQAIDWTKEGAGELFVALMALAPSFYAVVTSADDVTSSAKAMAAALREAMQSFDAARMAYRGASPFESAQFNYNIAWENLQREMPGQFNDFNDVLNITTEQLKKLTPAQIGYLTAVVNTGAVLRDAARKAKDDADSLRKTVDEVIGRDPAAEAMQSFETPVMTFMRLGNGLETMMATFDGTYDSVLAMARATSEWKDALRAALVSIENTRRQLKSESESARSQIMMGGTQTDESRYNTYNRLYKSTMAQLEVATDPEEIARLSRQAREYLMSAWGLLTPEQQDANMRGFLTQMDYLDTRWGEALDDAKDVVQDTADRIGAAVSTAMDQAATKISNAADVMMAAAQMMMNGAKDPKPPNVIVVDNSRPGHTIKPWGKEVVTEPS